jgi:hypothetical protein
VADSKCKDPCYISSDERDVWWNAKKGLFQTLMGKHKNSRQARCGYYNGFRWCCSFNNYWFNYFILLFYILRSSCCRSTRTYVLFFFICYEWWIRLSYPCLKNYDEIIKDQSHWKIFLIIFFKSYNILDIKIFFIIGVLDLDLRKKTITPK